MITLDGTDTTSSNTLTNTTITLTDSDANENSINKSGISISAGEISTIPEAVVVSNFITQMKLGIVRHINNIETAARSMNLLYDGLSFVNNAYSTFVELTASYTATLAEIRNYNSVTTEDTYVMMDKDGLYGSHEIGNSFQSGTYKTNNLQLYNTLDGDNYSSIIGNSDTGFVCKGGVTSQGTYHQSTLYHLGLILKEQSESIVNTLTSNFISLLNAGITLTLNSTGILSTGALSISTGAGQEVSVGTTSPTTGLNLHNQASKSVVTHIGDGNGNTVTGGTNINNGNTNLSNTQIHNGVNSVGTIQMGNGSGSSTAITIGETSGTVNTTTTMKGITSITKLNITNIELSGTPPYAYAPSNEFSTLFGCTNTGWYVNSAVPNNSNLVFCGSNDIITPGTYLVNWNITKTFEMTKFRMRIVGTSLPQIAGTTLSGGEPFFNPGLVFTNTMTGFGDISGMGVFQGIPQFPYLWMTIENTSTSDAYYVVRMIIVRVA